MHLSLSILTACSILLLSSVGFAQTSPGVASSLKELETGRIASTGHHALFDQHGRVIDPSIRELESWIAQEIKSMSAKTSGDLREKSLEIQKLVNRLEVKGPIANSLLLGWLAGQMQSREGDDIGQLNHVIREHWYRITLGPDGMRKGFDGSTALPIEIAKKARELGLVGQVSQALTGEVPGSDKYAEFCRKNEVPTPPDWVVRAGDTRGDWAYEGDLKTNFLRFGIPTEVWSYKSNEIPGTCIALPRFDDRDTISATGIVCLGKESGNACFYDKANMDVNVDHKIETFQGGTSLMGGGTCSDCHSGENPFIVHPAEPLNLGAAIRSPRWHTPLVKPSWPQNPGPSNILDLLALAPGQKACSQCHTPSFAGRFPDVLELNRLTPATQDNPRGLSYYCLRVVEGALNGRNWNGTLQGPTMGMVSQNNMLVKDSAFDTHRDAMLALCLQEPETPTTVPVPKDDREVISPPLIGPLYACADVIEVKGLTYNAEVLLTINGTDEPAVIAESSERVQFTVAPLKVDDVVQVMQTVDGQPSGKAQEIVISHLDDYPDGLPQPEIDPTVIHQCGNVIAVRHVKGATVTVTVTDSTNVFTNSFKSGGEWTNMTPAKSPFAIDDEFKAVQQLCVGNDKDVSDFSAVAKAGPPPSPMPVPSLDPSPPLEGQPYLGLSSLANGALTQVDEQSAGQVSKTSTAVNWNPEVNVANGLGRTVAAGDRFVITSTLCEKTVLEPDPARPCETLPVPRIAQPFVGYTSVTVIDYVPGARILVFGNGGEKIGDASGTEIGLTRAIQQGEVLTVSQRIGNCSSTKAYQIAALCISTKDCDLK